MSDHRDHVRIGRAAEMLGVTVDTVRHWADENRLRTVRSTGGQRLVPIEEVTRLTGERRQAATTKSLTGCVVVCTATRERATLLRTCLNSLLSGLRVPDELLVVVDGNPLKKLSLLEGQGAHLTAIIKGGRFFKNELR